MDGARKAVTARILVVFLALTLATTAVARIEIDADENVDFAAFRTFKVEQGNPMRSERICALARFVISLVQAPFKRLPHSAQCASSIQHERKQNLPPPWHLISQLCA